MKFNRNFINILSVILSVAIICFFSFVFKHIGTNINKEETQNIVISQNIIDEIEKNDSEPIEENSIISDDLDDDLSDSTKDSEISNDEFDWYIEIPKIKLYAPIEEGTNDEILNRSVGHFENTSRQSGNCGLAAHNRGYRVNYFAKVKELEKGDIIYYFVDQQKYKYKVENIFIIYETDWSTLENTEDDRITLITCVENREEYRLCVQGVLVEE